MLSIHSLSLEQFIETGVCTYRLGLRALTSYLRRLSEGNPEAEKKPQVQNPVKLLRVPLAVVSLLENESKGVRALQDFLGVPGSGGFIA